MCGSYRLAYLKEPTPLSPDSLCPFLRISHLRTHSEPSYSGSRASKRTREGGFCANFPRIKWTHSWPSSPSSTRCASRYAKHVPVFDSKQTQRTFLYRQLLKLREIVPISETVDWFKCVSYHIVHAMYYILTNSVDRYVIC